MDPSYTDMMNIIRECLLEGTDSTKNIKTELYKLNVYGTHNCYSTLFHSSLTLCCYSGRGSFVKPHIDTPRSEKMFGSLVIVLPTAHEGGALLLRRRGHEWIFDSGQALGAEGQPSIGYVAFFSGIEHEVAPVTSGLRITLTYNLYFDDGGPVSANDAVSEHLSPPLANKGAFREAFTALLENPEFLAEGGTLAFGLRHVYPISEDWKLKRTYGALKGSDAVVYQVVRALGYEPVLYMCYQGGYESAILDKVLGFERIFEESGENQITDIMQRQGGILVTEEGMEIQTDPRNGPQEQVEWVTPETEFNRQTSYYTDEDHEVASGDGDVCLVVRIGKTGDRLAYPTVAELHKAYEMRRV
jgi:hypothetical protein